MNLTTKQLVSSLQSQICPACGGRKFSSHTLCGKDYARLPCDLQQRLYRRIGEGYEAAITDAFRFLGADKFHAPPDKPAPPAARRPEDFRMPFGKHAGKSLGEIVACDPLYLDWARDNIERLDVAEPIAHVCEKYNAEIERAMDEREWRKQ